MRESMELVLTVWPMYETNDYGNNLNLIYITQNDLCDD